MSQPENMVAIQLRRVLTGVEHARSIAQRLVDTGAEPEMLKLGPSMAAGALAVKHVESIEAKLIEIEKLLTGTNAR